MNITSPLNGVVTTNETIAVEGLTDPRADVEINDLKLVAGSTGKFRVLVNLTIGDNEITIMTSDDLGNTKTTTVNVVREKKAEPPKPVGPGTDGNSWLLPLILIVLIVAAIGGGVGIYLMKKKKKEQAPPPQPPATAPQQGYSAVGQPDVRYAGFPAAPPPPQYPPQY